MSQPSPDLKSFEIDDELTFVTHESGLPKGIVRTEQCTGSFFLLGAHVATFQPTGQAPVLFMSEHAQFEKGKAIRGGIPICFPWFSAKKNTLGELELGAPAHGLVRTEPWELAEANRVEDGIRIVLALELPDYQLRYKVVFGSSLNITLETKNTSSIVQSHETALHTYFSVADVKDIEIAGQLTQLPFLDQLTGEVCSAQNQPIRFEAETDRIYQGASPEISLRDLAGRREIQLESHGSRSTVVWNPWIAKSQRMSDFGDEEYLRMCCIETANIGENKTSLSQGKSVQVGFRLSVRPPALMARRIDTPMKLAPRI